MYVCIHAEEDQAMEYQLICQNICPVYVDMCWGNVYTDF